MVSKEGETFKRVVFLSFTFAVVLRVSYSLAKIYDPVLSFPPLADKVNICDYNNALSTGRKKSCQFQRHRCSPIIALEDSSVGRCKPGLSSVLKFREPFNYHEHSNMCTRNILRNH